VDWIERLFHVSPDGGSGATELLYLTAAAIGIAAVARGRYVISQFYNLVDRLKHLKD